jgi:apolipoprotein N-acyltransferase
MHRERGVNRRMLPPAQVIEEFREKRRRQLLFSLPACVAFFVVHRWLGRDVETIFGLPAPLIGIAAVVIAAGYGLFTIWNWRCPSCEEYLGRSMVAEVCRKCGVRLKE